MGHHTHPPHAAPVVPLYFSNPDLLWANEHPAPRFGQGAFAAALGTLYQQVGVGLHCVVYDNDVCVLLCCVCVLMRCVC